MHRHCETHEEEFDPDTFLWEGLVYDAVSMEAKRNRRFSAKLYALLDRRIRDPEDRRLVGIGAIILPFVRLPAGK